MLDLWYKNAVIYCLDVETFMESFQLLKLEFYFFQATPLGYGLHLRLSCLQVFSVLISLKSRVLKQSEKSRISCDTGKCLVTLFLKGPASLLAGRCFWHPVSLLMH